MNEKFDEKIVEFILNLAVNAPEETGIYIGNVIGNVVLEGYLKEDITQEDLQAFDDEKIEKYVKHCCEVEDVMLHMIVHRLHDGEVEKQMEFSSGFASGVLNILECFQTNGNGENVLASLKEVFTENYQVPDGTKIH